MGAPASSDSSKDEESAKLSTQQGALRPRTEYEVMRLGFIPLDYLLVEKVNLSSIDVEP